MKLVFKVFNSGFCLVLLGQKIWFFTQKNGDKYVHLKFKFQYLKSIWIISKRFRWTKVWSHLFYKQCQWYKFPQMAHWLWFREIKLLLNLWKLVAAWYSFFDLWPYQWQFCSMLPLFSCSQQVKTFDRYIFQNTYFKIFYFCVN